jgi:transposase
MTNGSTSGSIFQKRTFQIVALVAGQFPRALCSRQCCGFSILARNGTCFRSAIQTTRRFIGAFSSGASARCLREILAKLANELRDRGDIDESECFIDATFASAKGGGAEIGPTRRGKGVKILAIVDRHGLPLSVSTHAANHHEVTLVQLSFDFYMIEAKPQNLIGDKAYDSDALDQSLKQQGIEMIAPHRSNRILKTQDGRRLRRYQRRWLVERYFAWLQWKRRLLVRWEYYVSNFLGFVELASITMLLKRF